MGRRTIKREAVKLLERARADMLASLSYKCHRCEQAPDLECPACHGGGVITPDDGIYSGLIVGSMATQVLDAVTILIEDMPTLDPDARELISWFKTYRIGAMAAALAKMGSLSDMREQLARVEELQGSESPMLRSTIKVMEELGPNATPDQIRKYLDDGPDDGDQPVEA